MNTKNNTTIVIAFVVVVVLFLLFGGGAMTEGMMNGGMHNGLNENGWMSDRGWMWFPALITLGLGIVLGWIIFRKKE